MIIRIRRALKKTGMLLLISLAACAAPVRERYYALSVPADSPTVASSVFDRDIIMRVTDIPEIIDRQQIVIFDASDEPIILDDHLWAESVRGGVSHAISKNLSVLLPNAWVTQTPSERTHYPVRVMIRIEEMTAVLSRTVELRASWIVQNGNDRCQESGRLGVQRAIGIDAKASDVVFLWSDEIATISRAIAESIVNVDVREKCKPN